MEESIIANFRLYNQHIDGNRFEQPEKVVKWMGAIQAQSYQQAIWGIGLRTQSATMADVERAITERKIVRTWLIRGTIHFVPSEDVKWMLELSAERMLAKSWRRLEQLELTEEILKRCHEFFYNELKGNDPITRPKLLQLLENTGISTKNQRGYQILWHAALSGVICLGPMEGKQDTFVLLDEWVPDSRKLSREESLRELAHRYFTSHGPATVHDFSWWAGLTVKDAKLGLELAASSLDSKMLNDTEYWLGKDVSNQQALKQSSLFLLPGFDEYLLGYKDRKAVLSVEHAVKVFPGNNGIFMPFIVENGQVNGIWKRTIKKTSIEISFSPFEPRTDLEMRLLETAERYSNFIGLTMSLIRV